MTNDEELREIAGRLAALTVPVTGARGVPATWDEPQKMQPDKRFDALRREHEIGVTVSTDLGAWVRVAAALGYAAEFAQVKEKWGCDLMKMPATYLSRAAHNTSADTPELAIARAMDAAVKEGG